MTDEKKAPNSQAAQGEQQAQFGIQKIYVKDLSFEAPNSPRIFTDEWNPAVDVQLGSKTEVLDENIHDVVLTVTVTVKFGEKSVYLAEVHQAGIFNITGIPDEHRERILATMCPNILFPYAREAISDLVNRGGFPQLLLAPVNFEAMYAQEKQRQQQSAGAGSGKTTH